MITRREFLRFVAGSAVAIETARGRRVLGQPSPPAGEPGILEEVFHNLLPRPRIIERIQADCVVSGATPITVLGPAPARCRQIGQILADRIAEEFGLRLPVGTKHSNVWQLRIGTTNAPPSLSGNIANDEGYLLEVSSRGSVAAAKSDRGLLWAAMTFRQLLARRGAAVVAAGCRINDWPRYRWRGFMIDSGRAPNSLAQMKRIVRVCSAFKLNYVIFREGDDELAAVRYRTNKLGQENPYALTIAQLAEFATYCEKYGLAVVPEIESLGHSTAKGFAYPELVGGGFEQKYPGIGSHIRKSSLKPDDPRSLQLLESMYDEWMPLLRSPLVHLGLDEVRLPKDAQAQHLARLLPLIARVAKKHSQTVTPMVWADAPPTPEAYRDRVIRVLWEYGDGNPVGSENKHLQNQHMADLAAPGCTEQVFMAGGSSSKHTPLSKTDCQAAFHNLAAWTRLGDDKPNFVGVLAVQWGGNMLDEWLPDFACAADYAWNPPAERPEFEPQMRRVKANFARLADAAHPRKEEVDRPAWDAIWLKGENWDSNILPPSVLQAVAPSTPASH